MPSAVAKATEIGVLDGFDNDTVNTAGVSPEFPSVTLTSLMLIVGSGSSFMIVPNALTVSDRRVHGVGQIHEEAFVRFEDGVAVDRDGDRMAGEAF